MLLGVALVLCALVGHRAPSAGAPCRRSRPTARDDQPLLLTVALAAQALLALAAVVGFGLRFRARGNDLDRWLASARRWRSSPSCTTSSRRCSPARYVSQGDFLRLLSYSVLLVGVWRAIRLAEFGRAVAEERARVAREIHDGLAQYLFAVSTHASMLESGADPKRTLPQLKEAAARRAAGGALRRARAVVGRRLRAVRLGASPLRRLPHRRRPARGRPRDRGRRSASRRTSRSRSSASSRKGSPTPASTRRPGGPRCGSSERAGERFVTVVDDGAGFDEQEIAAGQGLKNMRARAASIGGGFRLVSAPGPGNGSGSGLARVITRYASYP